LNKQIKRLSVREKQDLRPVVEAAQYRDEQSRAIWLKVGELLDKFESRGHSQCCPLGGVRTGARSSYSGETPCPCGWDSPQSSEDVLRRMVEFVGRRMGPTPDQDTTDLITDAMDVLSRVAKP
jgi:hypothetical protein